MLKKLEQCIPATIKIVFISPLSLLLKARMRPKNRKKHISVCLSGVPTTCNAGLFLASYTDSQMFPIDARVDGVPKDGAGDTDGRKPLK